MVERQTEAGVVPDLSAAEARRGHPRADGPAFPADDDNLSDEMIRAGADILLRFHREDDNEEEVAARVYRAMRKLRARR